jgi:ribonucleoside-diphosphate reductase alpha chain
MMQIIKRDGRYVEFNEEKIVSAICKAMSETELGIDMTLALQIAKKVKKEIKDGFDIEMIQNIIEEYLMKSNRRDVAKRYILYREEHNKLRKQPWKMTELREAIFRNKYEHNEEGMLGFFDRVSGGNEKIKKLMIEKKFLPAGRILANRGLHTDGRKITYSNCYVLTPPEDNIESIFDTAKKLARTYSYGGGVGIDISKLRPRDSIVNNAAKFTTGAVSFMDLYSTTTGLIGQNNRRK